MTRRRKGLISAAVLVLVAGHLHEVVRQHEHWPFSNYPMFAHRNTRDPVSRIGVFGVPDVPGAEPFELTDEHTGVYKNFRFQHALYKMLRNGREPKDPARLAAVLDLYFPYYERLRDLGYHDDPRLSALRIYRLEWDFHPQAANRREAPRMILLFERHRPPAELPPHTRKVLGALDEARAVTPRRHGKRQAFRSSSPCPPCLRGDHLHGGSETSPEEARRA